MTADVIEVGARRPAPDRVSPLEALRGELAAVDRGTVTVRVPDRPGWSVEYSLDLDPAVMAAWRKACEDTELDGTPVDEWLFNRVMCANLCRRLHRGGQVVTDETGAPVTFRTETFQRMLGVHPGLPDSPGETVRAFYANDFAVQAAAAKISQRAGVGQAAEEVDPTRPTSGPSPTGP